MVKQQWFVKMEEMAKPAIEALKNGSLTFVPESFGKTYLHWLEGIRDWCISRQLWWDTGYLPITVRNAEKLWFPRKLPTPALSAAALH